MGTQSTHSLQRPLEVGILAAKEICFSIDDGEIQKARWEEGKIRYDGELYDRISFPCNQHFTLYDVTIGIQFHWQRREAQTFKGTLRLQTEGELLRAVNEIEVEDYLASVISSEMSATSHLELLKAHAVLSRSWLLHPISSPIIGEVPEGRRGTAEKLLPNNGQTTSILRWYERDAHTGFDVCADDHCQRYQGITRQTAENVQKAIDATRSEVLMYDGEICDARFYKCCGGRTEVFETCWADDPHPYLESIEDPYCNTSDRRVLQQVLNDYDFETRDFHDWQVSYTQTELSNLVRQKSGLDIGDILDLVPIKRGPSGRICELQIVGSKQTLRVGKELEIRRLLSPSHLYSSAFTVKKTNAEDGSLRFLLTGKGWGHGVGLCQIGAAVMASKGYTYRQILAHYFPKATVTK